MSLDERRAAWVQDYLWYKQRQRAQPPRDSENSTPVITPKPTVSRFFWGRTSLMHLETLDEPLQRTANRALGWGIVDFAIIQGWRNEAEQNRAFEAGASTLRWPHSKHNIVNRENGVETPAAQAFDFLPYVGARPVAWTDIAAFSRVAGLIQAAGAVEGLRIRWGGDWNGDGRTTDHDLKDYGHVEVT